MNPVLLDEQENSIQDILFEDGSWVWRVKDLRTICSFEGNGIFTLTDKLFRRNPLEEQWIDFIYQLEDEEKFTFRTFELKRFDTWSWTLRKQGIVYLKDLDFENLFFDTCRTRLMAFRPTTSVQYQVSPSYNLTNLVTYRSPVHQKYPELIEWWKIFK